MLLLYHLLLIGNSLILTCTIFTLAAVRFPTELESERLMGLPEGWTKYSADGTEISPTNRYKALGNAIALPCADYIMAGIREAITRE